MTLQDIFDQLTNGELAQLNIGTGPLRTVGVDTYPKVVAHLNLGLTAIYKRFNLKNGYLTIPMVRGESTYAPAVQDILKIEEVTTDQGVLLPLNEPEMKYSVSTPTMNTLFVPLSVVNQDPDIPEEFKTDALHIQYRANHPRLPTTYTYPPSVQVELPESHLDALLYHVASRIYMPVDMTGTGTLGTNYLQVYEGICQQLEMQNYEIDYGTAMNKLYQKGFV